MDQYHFLIDDFQLYDLSNFDWYYKEEFDWKDFIFSKNKRTVFFGNKKDNPDFKVILKKIKINHDNNKKNYEHILKEIYFLVCCKNNSNFAQIVDIFWSDDEKYIFLIFKYEGVSLKDLIDYKEFDYTKINGFIKYVIFQIIVGLNMLHKAKLIHNDIKPSNILITSVGKTKICDLGSLDKSGNTRFSTICYSSPDALLQKKTSEKDDMWSVGVIMLELYKKLERIFNYKNIYSPFKSDKINQLDAILLQYKIFINNQEININNDNIIFIEEIIKNNECRNYNFDLNLNLDGIEPDAIELIKHLLEIDPDKRFNAEQALNSNYLSEYKNEIQKIQNTNKIHYKENDYKLFLEKVNNKETFFKNIKSIKQKFLGQVLFE